VSWLLWRQHRQQAAISAAAIALFAVVVWITGVHMAHSYDAIVACRADPSCQGVDSVLTGNRTVIQLINLTIAVPVLLGVFVGSTLIARETEQATNVLAWTQTVTRKRWLTAKVGSALVATLAVSGAVSALVTWWSGTPNSMYGNRFEGAQFDTQNIAPVAYALFAVSLGIAAGALLRRVLPALAVTIFGFFGVRLAVGVLLRPNFMSPVTQATSGNADVPSGSWTLSRAFVDSAGHAVGGQLQIPDICVASLDRGVLKTCLSQAGYHDIVRFHPASHYWRFQGMESGLFIILAALLVAFAVAYTLRHDA
jgi:hypothetical protein